MLETDRRTQIQGEGDRRRQPGQHPEILQEGEGSWGTKMGVPARGGSL